ncbi:MAG: gamma-glutamyltransferase family protein, partial [Betaproteobacteria bacterium]
SNYAEKPGWATQRFAVAGANPLATEAGYQVLKAGGSAVDAAIAVQMVLALVEPQSSGIGGGAFMLHFDGKRVQAFDGRETAPAAADEKIFLGADGKPMAFFDAVIGGRSVGVPGAVRMLELAYKEHGRLPWAQLFEPAITLAQRGFPVSARLHAQLLSERHLLRDPVAAAYFYAGDGSPHPVGHILKNPALARVLRLLAAQGANALHRGALAQAIVDKVRQHPTNPGRLSLDDLANYRALERAPVCHDYSAAAQAYRICGFPPPGSGAIAIGQILGMLQILAPTPAPLLDGLPSPEFLHLYTEASRLAFADRALYLADPDFVPAPAGDWMSLLASDYLARRASLIDARPQGQRMPQVLAGRPGQSLSLAPMPQQQEHGTSHISIVDAWGHALALTTTVEYAFGSGQMVQGFLLNNELTDFSFSPADAQGRAVANRVQPGKRPRSSMAPTLVFERRADGSLGPLLFSGGSAGGAFIIHFVTKSLYAAMNWQLNAQQAVALPNFGSLGGPVLLEEQRFPTSTIEALKARGHSVQPVDMTSGSQLIQKTANGFFGGADPRREGTVRGD